MVEWTDDERQIITNIFANLDYDEIGHQTLCRCLIVYPWTQRYFGAFGNLYSAQTILANPLIAKHGTKIVHGLDLALKNMDDIKNTYTKLSELHSEVLHVDSDNFRLMAECMTVCIAAKMGYTFSIPVQAALTKFLAVVVSALGRQYH